MNVPENRMEKFALDRAEDKSTTHGAKTCPACGKRGTVHKTWHALGKQSPVQEITTRYLKCDACGRTWYTREQKDARDV